MGARLTASGGSPRGIPVIRPVRHANISITLDRYGHLMPGNEAEARGMLEAYLDHHDG